MKLFINDYITNHIGLNSFTGFLKLLFRTNSFQGKKMSSQWDTMVEMKNNELKFQDPEEEDNYWEMQTIEERIRLKENARQQCIESKDDTLPLGVDLTQDEDGWGGEWKYDFLQEANSFWGSLPSGEDKLPNNKGRNVSLSPTSCYNVAFQQTGLEMSEAVELETQLLDGSEIISPKKLFAEMVVHWFEGHKNLRGISVEDWRNFGFWGSSKFEEIKKSKAFLEVESVFQEMEDEIKNEGESKFISNGTPIKVNQFVHWPIINKLFEGYKAELPKKFSFNPHACEFIPNQTFTICV